MTTPIFPSYAQFVLDGFKPKREKNTNRTPFDDGSIKQDPVNSRRVTSTSVKYLLRTPADKAAFDQWVELSLRFGAYWFVWTNPETSTITRARIRDGEVEYEALTSRMDEWAATFTIEFWS